MVHYIDLLLSPNMLQPKSSKHSVNAVHQPSCCDRCLSRTKRIGPLICGPDGKSNRRRFWYVSIFFAVSSYIMCLANVATEYRSEKQLRGIILPDIGFDFAEIVTPSITTWIKWPDISVPVAAAITMSWLIVDGPRDQKLSVFRRFLVITSIMYLLRSICVISTQLPNPFQTDDPKYHYKWSKDIVYEALLVLLRIKATNNDVFFSGHTTLIAMCALTLDTYCKRKWLIAVFWISALCTLYVIIATKFHYTIDVVIAFALTIVIWKLYHLAMSIEELRNNYPIFKFLESDRESELFRECSSSVNRTRNGLSAPLIHDGSACNNGPAYKNNASAYNLDSVPIVADIVELSEERGTISINQPPRTPKSTSRTQSITITKSDLP